MTDETFHGLGGGRAAIDANNHDAALKHLIHDVGIYGERYLATQETLVQGILRQRRTMEEAGTLYDGVDESGHSKLVGKLDLKALGISEADIAKALEITSDVIGDRYAAALERATKAAAAAEAAAPSQPVLTDALPSIHDPVDRWRLTHGQAGSHVAALAAREAAPAVTSIDPDIALLLNPQVDGQSERHARIKPRASGGSGQHGL